MRRQFRRAVTLSTASRSTALRPTACRPPTTNTGACSTSSTARAPAPARLLLGEPHVEIDNLDDTAAYRSGDANRRALVDLGRRALPADRASDDKDDRIVGNVMIFRQEQRRFTDKQIRLLQQFAAQAVIAIENRAAAPRIAREHRGIDRGAETPRPGSANILKVIASSPTDVGPALKAIVESARELCDAYDAAVALKEGDSRASAPTMGRFRSTSRIGRSTATGPRAVPSSTGSRACRRSQ